MTRAFLYVSDAMNAEERIEFERELDRSEELRAEVERLRGVTSSLLESAPAVSPPEDLRDRVMARIATIGPTLSRETAAEWHESGVEGVSLRRLFMDPGSGRETILVRLRAGAVYPMHHHTGHEECYVIEGDLIDGDIRMNAGDYTCFPTGSHHGPLTTEQGCLLLVQAPAA